MRIFLWNIVEKHGPFNREPRKILKKNENTESSLRRISDRVKTRQVGREGKFALESCGYKPCATAYHPTLSTSPIESTVTRCTTCIPPHRWRQPRYTVSTRCPVYSSILVSRGRKRNTEFEGGEKGYRRRRNTKEEGREKPLGTRGVQTVSSSSSSSSRDSSRNFHFVLARCSFLAELFDPTESPGNASVWFSRMLRKVDRLIVSRKGIGDDCRAVLHLVQFTPREIIKSWTWHENEEICLIFIYACGIEKAKGGSWIWLFFEIIYDCFKVKQMKISDRERERDTSFPSLR